MTIRRSAALLTMTLFLGISAIACSSTSTTPSTCDDLQTLASEVQALTSVNVIKSGTSGIKDQTDKISSTLDDLKKSGSEQFGSDIDALKSSITAFDKTVVDRSSSGSVSDFTSKVKTDIRDVSSAWEKLESSASAEFSDCDLKVTTTSS